MSPQPFKPSFLTHSEQPRKKVRTFVAVLVASFEPRSSASPQNMVAPRRSCLPHAENPYPKLPGRNGAKVYRYFFYFSCCCFTGAHAFCLRLIRQVPSLGTHDSESHHHKEVCQNNFQVIFNRDPLIYPQGPQGPHFGKPPHMNQKSCPNLSTAVAGLYRAVL